MKKYSRIIPYFLATVVASTIFTGCGFIPEVSLTEEQEDLISEYSAGLLMKYNKGHSSGLQRISDVEFKDLNVTPTPTPIPDVIDAPEPEELSQELDQEDISGESDVAEDVASIEDEEPSVPLNEALGLYGADVNASYIELVDSYPATGEELLLAMKATEGNELLILHFDIANNSGEDINLATDLADKKVRVLVNGQEKIRCEMTLLSNDLLNYTNVLPAGGKDDEVLVFEKKKNIEISSLTLILINSQEELKYNLY